MNTFSHARAFPPAATLQGATHANFDTHYSVGLLDLTKEPIIISTGHAGPLLRVGQTSPSPQVENGKHSPSVSHSDRDALEVTTRKTMGIRRLATRGVACIVAVRGYAAAAGTQVKMSVRMVERSGIGYIP